MRSIFISFLLFAGVAQASPVALEINSGYTLATYTGAAAVNAGNVDIRSTLFAVREQQVGNIQSWYLFFDPSGNQSVQATLDFGGKILDVITTSAGLASSLGTYGTDVDGDGVFNDYSSRAAMGLESGDRVQWALGGRALAIDWNASDPGDHVRVLVQLVPEPATAALALLGMGLGIAGATRRRKTR
jgi:hypothetical protein